MEIPKSELNAILQEYNPWWFGQPILDLPEWQRTAGTQVWEWVKNTNNKRSLLLTGARQVGKTTVLRQTIRRLVAEGYPAQNIIYATFDHPLLKLAGLEATLDAWEKLIPTDPSVPRMLFFDEIQFAPGWQTWNKHRSDFKRSDRVIATGSATALADGASESGLGRIETIPLPTLSFKEYLQLRLVPLPDMPMLRSLREVAELSAGERARVIHQAEPLTVHFHEYLIRGGFPEPALQQDIARGQRLLREDIIDKALKRDMTAFYKVRRILELERLFLYLCYHDGGILDLPTISGQLEGVSKALASSFIDLFEATHLIYRLKPYGYGKEVLRGRDKIYLADAAIPGAVTLQGRHLLQRPERLGSAVETAFFKHVFTRFYGQAPRFSYWQGPKKVEVDVIAELPDRAVPFEVKYQDAPLNPSKLLGLRYFCEKYDVPHAYVITQRWEEFGVHQLRSPLRGSETVLPTQLLSIPAPLACLWLS